MRWELLRCGGISNSPEDERGGFVAWINVIYTLKLLWVLISSHARVGGQARVHRGKSLRGWFLPSFVPVLVIFHPFSLVGHQLCVLCHQTPGIVAVGFGLAPLVPALLDHWAALVLKFLGFTPKLRRGEDKPGKEKPVCAGQVPPVLSLSQGVL